MSNESLLQTLLTTDVPRASGVQENYIHLLVLLCVFVVGALILLSILLICCYSGCRRQHRRSRAREEQEKTNTTFIEENQPTQGVTLRLDSSETLSISSCHGNTEVEHFLSAAATTRRVSFNEAAVHAPNTEDKARGRRYTLTEGDFHHLKKSRLTHFHPPALKILTILECDSPENSINSISEEPKHTLSIFPHSEGLLPESSVLWSSCTLPGDSLNASITNGTKPPPSQTAEIVGRNVLMDRDSASCSISGVASGGRGVAQGGMFHFLSKLRRHASLEGAGPFHSQKKRSFDTIQRTTSLDMRGSTRRRAFQKQRAASETLAHEEEQLQDRVCDFLLQNPLDEPQVEGLRRLSAGSLDIRAGSSASLTRLEVETIMEIRYNVEANLTDVPLAHRPLKMNSVEKNGAVVTDGASGGAAAAESHQKSLEQHSLYRDIWSLRASLERYASSDLSSNDRDSTRSDADSVCSTGASRAGVASCQSQDIDDELDGDCELPYDDVVREAGLRRNGQDSIDSERGADGETTSRKLLQMDSGYASIEAPCKAPEESRLFGSASGKTASERRRFFTSTGRKGTVCESFEARLFREELEKEVFDISVEEDSPVTVSHSRSEASSAAKPQAPYRRRDYSIDEKTETLFNEFLRHDPQFDHQASPSLRHRYRSRVHLRKQWQRSKQYSDPGAARYSPSLERQRCYPLRRGDSANYPLDTRYHSTLPRIASAADEEASEGAAASDTPEQEQGSDGGFVPDLEDNANNSSNNTSGRFPLSPLPGASGQDCGTLEDFETTAHATDLHKHFEFGGSVSSFSYLHPHADSENIHHTHPDQAGLGHMHQIFTDINPSDKLGSTLDDGLYSSLRTRRESQACVTTVSHTSADAGEE